MKVSGVDMMCCHHVTDRYSRTRLLRGATAIGPRHHAANRRWRLSPLAKMRAFFQSDVVVSYYHSRCLGDVPLVWWLYQLQFRCVRRRCCCGDCVTTTINAAAQLAAGSNPIIARHLAPASCGIDEHVSGEHRR